MVGVDGREFVLADIPGLIEGAHEGVGLGDRFLGHVERCRVILHLVDANGEHAGRDYKTVRHELEAYGGGLVDKSEVVALSKVDVTEPDHLKKQVDRLRRACGHTPMRLSSATRTHVTEVLRALTGAIDTGTREAEAALAAADVWRP